MKLKSANILRKIARFGLLIISILVFMFASISGVEGSIGLSEIINNFPM